MFFSSELFDVVAIFPDNDMCKHSHKMHKNAKRTKSTKSTKNLESHTIL